MVNVPAVTVSGVPVVFKVSVLAPVTNVALALFRVSVPVERLVEAVSVQLLVPVMLMATATLVVEQVVVELPVKLRVE